MFDSKTCGAVGSSNSQLASCTVQYTVLYICKYIKNEWLLLRHITCSWSGGCRLFGSLRQVSAAILTFTGIVQNMEGLTVCKERMKSGPTYFANDSVFLCIPG